MWDGPGLAGVGARLTPAGRQGRATPLGRQGIAAGRCQCYALSVRHQTLRLGKQNGRPAARTQYDGSFVVTLSKIVAIWVALSISELAIALPPNMARQPARPAPPHGVFAKSRMPVGMQVQSPLDNARIMRNQHCRLSGDVNRTPSNNSAVATQDCLSRPTDQLLRLKPSTGCPPPFGTAGIDPDGGCANRPRQTSTGLPPSLLAKDLKASHESDLERQLNFPRVIAPTYGASSAWP